MSMNTFSLLQDNVLFRFVLLTLYYCPQLQVVTEKTNKPQAETDRGKITEIGYAG